MKNKKGFTLVELLAVILILGILMVVAVPSINSTSNKTKERMLKTKIELAQQNLLLWGQDNKKCFIGGGIDCLTMTCSGTTNITCTVTLKAMADYGLIDYDNEEKEVINPVDKSNISNETITIEYNTSNKAFTITNNSILN